MLERFANFLAQQWEGGATSLHGDLSPGAESLPWHWYQHSGTYHWKGWQRYVACEQTPFAALPKAEWWWCRSLREASEHYSWPAGHGGATLEALSIALQREMKEGNEVKAGDVCRNIFRWGGVARKETDLSLQWVVKQVKCKTLIPSLRRAVDLLSPSDTRSTDIDQEFAADKLLMNSAMTKVYVAADEAGRVVMYDSRVGAALCLLVRQFMRSAKIVEIPAALVFFWGPPTAGPRRNRDPSDEKYRVKSLNGYKVTGAMRAEAAWGAGVIAEIVTKQLEVTTRDLEKGLFMVGYKVWAPELPQSPTPL